MSIIDISDIIIIIICLVLCIIFMLFINRDYISLYCKTKYEKDNLTIYKEELKNNSFEDNIVLIEKLSPNIVKTTKDDELL